MSKKISVGLTIAIAALAAAIAFFAGNSMALNKINETLIDVNEKQAMYGKLNELDQCVRTNIGESNIDEKALTEGICKGYISGLDDSDVSYYTAEEFSKTDIQESEGTKVITFSDGSAVVINIDDNTSQNQQTSVP